MIKKKAIVTGSAGFIGGHLCEKLLEKGYEVVGIDNLKTGLSSTTDMLISKGSFYPKYLDISEGISLSKIDAIFAKFLPNYVFHLAAIPGVSQSVLDPTFSHRTNVLGTLNMLDLSKKHKVDRFILSSSSSVYGGASTFPTSEESPTSPKSPYALQKLTSEKYCKLFSELHSLDTACLRYFNVFGPRQRADSAYAAAIASFCKNKLQKNQPTIFGDGSQTRDFCFVGNVVDANILCAEYKHTLEGEVFNIGSGKSISIKDVCKKLGLSDPLYKQKRVGDVQHSLASIEKANRVLGYKARVDFDSGLNATLKWLNDRSIHKI